MALQDALDVPERVKAHAFVVIATVALFLENLTRSYQYAVREEMVVSARTAFDWVISIGGPYFLVPGVLFVSYYVLSGVGPKRLLTGRFVVALSAGVLVGSLCGQYVGGAPHSLVFLKSSETFAVNPVILRLWIDVFGAISRDLFAVIGILVLAREVRHGGWNTGNMAAVRQ